MRAVTLLLTTTILLLTVSLVPVSAVGPLFWRINTRAEVERGDARGVSIADNGAMTLAPAVNEVFDTKQAYIWSSAADAAGNIYLGTGHEGRIFKIDPQGKGTLLYKSNELDIMALTVDAKGNIYAGSSPDGKVYRISPGGEARVFFEPKAKYIWSLTFDAQGRLLVGTGDKGIVYRVNPDGQGAPLVTTTQTNITALSIDRAGNIIAGTDPGGLVLRISPEGRVFTLFDSSLREIRDLAIGGSGEIYALVLAEAAGSGASNASSPAAAPAQSVPTSDEGVTVTISDVQVVESSGSAASAGSSSASSGGGLKSILYRLDPNGAAESLWESRDTAFALALGADGRVLVGTGNKGRIYTVAAREKPLLLAQSMEAQTARFIRLGDRLYAATSNLGKLYRVNHETNTSGTYTSTVRDAGTSATWGRLSWVGEGEVEIQTRSGNTATPDSTWSDWSQPIRVSEGGPIQSPPSRFMQWRSTLKRGPVAPRLREVTVSYLPRNIAPKINGISILPIGVALQPVPQTPADPGAEQAGLDPQALGNAAPIPPRRIFQRGAVSLQWQVEDRNGDALEYVLSYRAANGNEYYPLKSGLRETYFTIETNALPDGRYVFKLVASDLPANPAAMALTDDQETEPIEIDNSPPTVTAGQPTIDGAAVSIEFQGQDATSILRRAEYQLDGGDWMAVYPVDGIADARRESYRVQVKLPDNRPHVIAFRVFDANANVGGAQVSLPTTNR
jgi:sugar lactone lactonase YvrE